MAYETRGRLQSRRGIVLQDNNAVCRVRELKPFNQIAIISTVTGGWSGSRQETLITDAIAQVESFFFFYYYLFFLKKKRNNLNSVGRVYYGIKTAEHICIHRAALFTRTLQTMHYHFKAGQVWFLVRTRKTGWNRACRLHLIIFSPARLRAEGAAINQLVFAVNLCRLCHNSHKAVEGRWCLMPDRDFSEESKAML